MSDPEFYSVYEDEKRRDYIARATLGTFVSIPLNLSCTFMDHGMYPDHAAAFLKARLISVTVSALAWLWFKTKIGRAFPQANIFWFTSPMIMILWMIYAANDHTRYSPYYAGLNIIMLGMGLLSSWAYIQNLVTSLFVLGAYVFISFAMNPPQPISSILNNSTFLMLTAVLVVSGSVANSRSRFREFSLRYELDKKGRELEDSYRQLQENEAQLVQSEKLASLGRMSAGMIHEINNPLNFATTGLFTLRKKGKYLAPEQQEDYADTLKDIEEGVNRVKTIVSDLRMFTHPDTEQRDRVAVSEVVTAALRFLNNECKDKVVFETDLPAGQTIWANKNKLIHVLTNLLQNSLDALKTKTFNNEKPTVRISGRMENGLSFLIVHDNGPGIAAQHLDKIYDPFFTTKDVGEGMGLGLSICYRIVRESKGKISVRTEPAKFCEFTLEFPATEKNGSAAPKGNHEHQRL
jgi:two-component system sensor histidine kinase PhcS